MGWTNEQKRAIEEGGKNILISAGAGSGKTAVLSSRVYNHVANHKWNIDEMLILTFTNAAANEMKTRIRKRISDNEDSLLTDIERLTQINKIDSAYITTFDAYALSLVKKYHYILNVDRDINIIDSNILSLKIDEVIKELMLEKYKENDERFVKLIKDFCVKDDDNIIKTIKYLNNKLALLYNRQEFVSNYENDFFSSKKMEEYFNKYEQIVLENVKEFNCKLNELSTMDVDVFATYENITPLLQSNSYSEVKENIEKVNIKPLRKASDEAKALKKEIKEKNFDRINELTYFTKEQLIEQIESTKEYVLVIFEIVEKLNSKIKKFKKENNIYEFNDIFKMAIELVDKHEDIRKEIKNSFKEILIDEYQDTSDLQDIFISFISNNNVYMVGDIKQSIYRFRNANPNLFREKFEKYRNNIDGETIILPHNFRSKKEVLENINIIFNRIMDLKIGGANYTDGHQMIKLDDQSDDTSNNLEILNYTYDKKEYPFNEFKQNEIEAFIIAEDIKNKIDNKYQITYKVKENNEEILKSRDCEYSDFCVLIDRGTNFDLIKNILTYYNIPVNIEQEEKMDDSDLIAGIKSIFTILSCIDNNDFNYNFKYSFVSLARSFLVEESDENIFDYYRNDTIFDSCLYKRIFLLHQNIKTKSITNLIDEIVKEFDVYTRINKIGDVNNNLIKLDYLYKLANNLGASGYDYRKFDQYLTKIFNGESDSELKFNTIKDNENAVRMMNVHKSKGLEFNICYFPLLTVRFNQQDVKDRIIFSNEEGLITPCMIENKGLLDTILKENYINTYLKEDIGERIRLFYVALTRTKEKMIMVAPLVDKSESNTKVISDYKRSNIKSFVDILNLIYSDLKHEDYIKDIDLNKYSFTKDYLINNNTIFTDDLMNYTKGFSIKEKTEVKPKIIEKKHYSKSANLVSKEQKEVMDFGTRMHYYLETLDFNNPDLSKIEARYHKKIINFLNSEIMKNKSKGKAIKEYEFVYKDNEEIKHGFIDLLMEYDDHFDIIDYKLKNIDDENYDKQLNGYRHYLQQLTDKRVDCYIYSIVDSNYRIVND